MIFAVTVELPCDGKYPKSQIIKKKLKIIFFMKQTG